MTGRLERLRGSARFEGPGGCLLAVGGFFSVVIGFGLLLLVVPMWVSDGERIATTLDGGTVGCEGRSAKVWEPHLDFLEARAICDEEVDDAEALRWRATVALGVCVAVAYGVFVLTDEDGRRARRRQ